MIHLAPIGFIYEGPGLTGRVVTTLNAPVATLCGARTAEKGKSLYERPGGATRVIMPHDDPRSCRECLKLLPSRRSEVAPLLLPEV